ncbi:MAG: hypothetical protein V4543_16610 [Bacteroidota bacterium]
MKNTIIAVSAAVLLFMSAATFAGGGGAKTVKADGNNKATANCTPKPGYVCVPTGSSCIMVPAGKANAATKKPVSAAPKKKAACANVPGCVCE